VGSDGTLTLWDIATGKQLGVRQLERTSLQHAAFTANGALLGVVSGDVYLIDTHTGEELVVLQRDEVELTRIAFSTDGTLVAAVCADGSVRFWDVQRE
jgi:WD40 repeat protein